jgi:hypothetical protein
MSDILSKAHPHHTISAAQVVAATIVESGDESGFLTDHRIDRSFRVLVGEFVRACPVTV